MTLNNKIINYLNSRKTPATALEITNALKANYNTIRKLLGSFAVAGKRNNFNTYHAFERLEA